MTFFARFPAWAIVLAILIIPGGTLFAPLLLLNRQAALVAGRRQ